MNKPVYILKTYEALVTPSKTSLIGDFTPSPVELYFYEDRLEIYFPSRYHGKRDICRETYIIEYSGINICRYKIKSTTIEILGSMEFIRYRFDKNGNLPDKPSRHVNVKNGGMSFNIRLAEGVDVIKEIELHSPIRVVIENKY